VFASFLYLLFKTGRDFRLLVNPFTPLVTKTLIASSALLLLQVVHHAFVFVDRAFISFLPKGAVGALAYAWVVVGLVPALLNPGGSFITVFAEHKDNPTRADGMVNEMLTMILLFGIPTSFFLAVFGTDIIALMLERGLFSQADTELTANGLMGFALAIVPLLLVNPLDQIFQVSNKLGLILRRSLVGLLANVVLNWIFLFMLGWGVLGVALATSLSYTVMVATGLLALPRIGIAIYWRIHMRWAGVLTIVSAVAVIVSNKAVGLLPSALRLPVGILLFSGLVALAATHGNAPGPILLKSVLSRIGRRGLRVFGKA
jgi:peptidoglycan biosynthesis protein MviN/MurJ (putative lipid II flippase)